MDFIRSMVARDLESGKHGGRVVTRFPPEPNGFLHVGHAKAICLNFGIAAEHPGGRCHLRLDDTNPDTEKAEYVEAMKRDIRWLGFDWGEHLYHASDYFEELYRFAMVLVDKGLAYVDSSSEEEVRERRGSVTRPGANSPFRDRTVEENRDLFRRMRAGDFPDGSHVLRAKIDMAHPNMVMRDPVLYRVRHAAHYRQGDAWPIYPLYDFAHCLSDSLEGVTHSLCTLEFDNNREIYDWLLEHVDAPRPRPEQTEFARLALDYVVTSKRKLAALVDQGRVRGWDDPRMPTLAGLRRRGVTAAAIRALCELVGVSKANSQVDLGKLEFAVRNDLNRRAPRAFCVLQPLKVVLTNYPADREEWISAPCFPPDVGKPGTRKLPFGRVLRIDRDDFREDPPPGFRRLSPGGAVRLKYAGAIRCDSVEKDPETGRPVELRCTFEPESGPRPKGAVHWLSERHAVQAEVRLYDRLFRVPDPLAGQDDFMAALNPDSERIVPDALLEPGLAETGADARYQFERLGYFFADPTDSSPGRPVFNRTVALRDGWKAQGRAVATSGSAGRAGAKATEDAHGAASTGGDPSASTGGDPSASTGSNPSASTGGDPSGRATAATGASPARQRATGSRSSAPLEAALGPQQRAEFDRLRSLGVAEAAAASLSGAPRLLRLLRDSLAHYPDGPGSLASWLANEVAGLSKVAEDGSDRLAAASLAELVRAVDRGELSRRQGRAVLSELLARGGAFEDARAGLDLREIDDEAVIGQLLADIVREHPDKAAAYRDGRRGLLGFFVGEVMKRTQGKADPRKASQLAAAILEEAAASSAK